MSCAPARPVDGVTETLVERLERRLVMEAPTGRRFCVVRIPRPGYPKNADPWK